MSRKPDKRSDKIRQRLDNESKAWINQASTRLTTPDSSFRSLDDLNRSSEPSILHGAKKQNRIFRIGWRTFSFLLVGFFSYALFIAWQSPMYKVNNVSISGLQRISQDDVFQHLDIIGNHIFSLDKNAIESQLQRNYPELWDIEIFLSLPAQVSIKLIERQPMIEWDYKNQRIWIDAEGYLIPARSDDLDLLSIHADAIPPYQLVDNTISDEENDIEHINNIIKDKPQINQDLSESIFFAFSKQIDPNLLTAILQLNAWMPEEKMLLYEAMRGVGWEDKRGWNVFIGSKLENINDKMLMYEMIVRELDKEGISPSMVSVEFLHAPYYRLEDDHG